MADVYTRKVSSEEASEGYLMVEKAKLGFFPAEGEQFELEGAGTVALDSYPCTCRGPEKAHRHWLIRLGGLEKGAPVTIRRDGSRYALE